MVHCCRILLVLLLLSPTTALSSTPESTSPKQCKQMTLKWWDDADWAGRMDWTRRVDELGENDEKDCSVNGFGVVMFAICVITSVWVQYAEGVWYMLSKMKTQ